MEEQEQKLPRSIRRGHITNYLGVPINKRPFNNRANTCKRKKKHSRTMAQLKRNIKDGIRRAEEKQVQ